MEPANFSFSDWEANTDAKLYVVPVLNSLELPMRPDRYSRGHLTMGKDVDRGLAIQRGRDRRRLKTNQAFFLATVLPLIETRLNCAAWKELAFALDRPEFFTRGGFVHYVLGERASWIHSTLEPEKIAQAQAMGATPEDLLS